MIKLSHLIVSNIIKAYIRFYFAQIRETVLWMGYLKEFENANLIHSRHSTSKLQFLCET